MATIPGSQKIRTIDASVDMTERGSALINSKSEVYTMDDIIETVGGGTIPILTEYPSTDATKVGQKFIYKGNEWKYHSQAELDDLGWTTVSEGFPAPVDKKIDLSIYRPTKEAYRDLDSNSLGSFENYEYKNGYGDVEIDFVGLGKEVTKFTLFYTGFKVSAANTLSKIRNAVLLINLEDLGTSQAMDASSIGLTDTVIDDLFTQLPPTTKTATINVSSNPGAATCDPTIATAKGYTVITA